MSASPHVRVRFVAGCIPLFTNGLLFPRRRGVNTYSSPREQTVKDLGTGLAGRRKEAQGKGAELAPKLNASGYMAIQARERWSLTELRWPALPR